MEFCPIAISILEWILVGNVRHLLEILSCNNLLMESI